MTTGKTIALTRQNFVGKVMSLLFNMLSRLVITFLPRSKRLLISWLQSPSAVNQTCGGYLINRHPSCFPFPFSLFILLVCALPKALIFCFVIICVTLSASCVLLSPSSQTWLCTRNSHRNFINVKLLGSYRPRN